MRKSRPLWTFGMGRRQLRVGQPAEPVIVVSVKQPAEFEMIISRRDLKHMQNTLEIAELLPSSR